MPFKPELRDAFAANDEMRASMGQFNEFFPDGRWKSFLVVNIGHPGENAWRERLPRLNAPDVIRWD
jgi:3-hydroxypropanoate dehydrogenase